MPYRIRSDFCFALEVEIQLTFTVVEGLKWDNGENLEIFPIKQFLK
jgi:hypothetical protein